MKKIYPLVITDNIKEAADFYVHYFNFTIVFQQDWYVQLVHETSGEELAFMVPNATNQPAELHAAFSGKGLVYSFETEDAQKEYERLSKTDIKMIHELKDEEWGQRHFMVQDPAGIYVDIVQQLEG